MSDENLFAEVTPTSEATAAPQTQQPSLPEEVMALVGTGKKYATPEDALRSVPHAQAHIARLEQEMQELRERAAQAKAIDDVYEALVSRQQGEQVATAQAPIVDERFIDAVLERKLEEQKRVEEKRANLSKVRESLTAKFGEKAPEAFKKKAEELGINEGFLTDLAAKSPAAALELFGANAKEKVTTAVPSGSINPQAFVQNQQPAPPKAVMAGASTSDLLNAWRAVNPLNNQ
jgi:predicted  nucleic acid-binding Zn-ribbon protein